MGNIMSDFNLYSVNWRDGMLLTQEHLRLQEQYLEELSRRYNVPLGDRWGLVRFGASSRVALTLNASVTGDQVRVELVHCQAITPDGHLIHVTQSGGRSLRASIITSPEDSISVWVSVQTEERQEFGDPDPAEEIPRMPYRAASYALHLGPRPEVPPGQVVQVALLVMREKEVNHSPSYIPPSVTLFSDDRLHQKAVEIRNRLETLLSIGNRAFTTLSAGGAMSGEGSDIKSGLQHTIYQFVTFLSSTLDEFVVSRNAGHPQQAVVWFRKQFRMFHTLLSLRPSVRDYLHERYFVKEAGSDISRFMSAIDQFLLSEYNHENIGQHMESIENILEMIRGLLSHIAHVKEEQLGPQAIATESLTYAGRTFKQAPYGGTRIERLGELTYVEVQLGSPQPMKDTVILLSKDLATSNDWSGMHVRLGLNEARGLGETDPVAIDSTSFGDKVALHPHDMLHSQSVKKVTLIIRGLQDATAFESMSKSDLVIYAV